VNFMQSIALIKMKFLVNCFRRVISTGYNL